MCSLAKRKIFYDLLSHQAYPSTTDDNNKRLIKHSARGMTPGHLPHLTCTSRPIKSLLKIRNQRQARTAMSEHEHQLAHPNQHEKAIERFQPRWMLPGRGSYPMMHLQPSSEHIAVFAGPSLSKNNMYQTTFLLAQLYEYATHQKHVKTINWS